MNLHAERESSRANHAEKQLQRLLALVRDLNIEKDHMRSKLLKAEEELRMYKIQFDVAQREIFRAQETVNLIESQRVRALERSSRDRDKLRKVLEERAVYQAHEDGRRIGFEQGSNYRRREGYPYDDTTIPSRSGPRSHSTSTDTRPTLVASSSKMLPPSHPRQSSAKDSDPSRLHAIFDISRQSSGQPSNPVIPPPPPIQRQRSLSQPTLPTLISRSQSQSNRPDPSMPPHYTHQRTLTNTTTDTMRTQTPSTTTAITTAHSGTPFNTLSKASTVSPPRPYNALSIHKKRPLPVPPPHSKWSSATNGSTSTEMPVPAPTGATNPVTGSTPYIPIPLSEHWLLTGADEGHARPTSRTGPHTRARSRTESHVHPTTSTHHRSVSQPYTSAQHAHAFAHPYSATSDGIPTIPDVINTSDTHPTNPQRRYVIHGVYNIPDRSRLESTGTTNTIDTIATTGTGKTSRSRSNSLLPAGGSSHRGHQRTLSDPQRLDAPASPHRRPPSAHSGQSGRASNGGVSNSDVYLPEIGESIPPAHVFGGSNADAMGGLLLATSQGEEGVAVETGAQGQGQLGKDGRREGSNVDSGYGGSGSNSGSTRYGGSGSNSRSTRSGTDLMTGVGMRGVHNSAADQLQYNTTLNAQPSQSYPLPNHPYRQASRSRGLASVMGKAPTTISTASTRISEFGLVSLPERYIGDGGTAGYPLPQSHGGGSREISGRETAAPDMIHLPGYSGPKYVRPFMSNGTPPSSRETSRERGGSREGDRGAVSAGRGREVNGTSRKEEKRREQTPEEIVREWRSKNPDVAGASANGRSLQGRQGTVVQPARGVGSQDKKGKGKEKEKSRGMEAIYAEPARASGVAAVGMNEFDGRSSDSHRHGLGGSSQTPASQAVKPNAAAYTLYGPPSGTHSGKNAQQAGQTQMVSYLDPHSQMTTPSNATSDRSRDDIGIEVMPPSRPTSLTTDNSMTPIANRTYLSPEDAHNHTPLPQDNDTPFGLGLITTAGRSNGPTSPTALNHNNLRPDSSAGADAQFQPGFIRMLPSNTLPFGFVQFSPIQPFHHMMAAGGPSTSSVAAVLDQAQVIAGATSGSSNVGPHANTQVGADKGKKKGKGRG